MDYKKIHDALIERAKTRTLDGYYEVHHIVPRCMGGKDETANLVKLTPEEHYVVHQLLVKIYPDNRRLSYAAIKMCQGRPTNKLYGWIRRRFAQDVSANQSGEGNSQHGSYWITNGSQNKKHRGDELPDGWLVGRTYPPVLTKPIKMCNDCTDLKLVPIFNVIDRCDNCAMAYEWFDKFNRSNSTSIREFVRESDYPYSHVSFTKMLKRYVSEFQPQHGKKFSSVADW